jgi:polysaccharide export outer membrane protein
MLNGRRDALRVGWLAVWAVCAAQAGCVTLFPRPASNQTNKDAAAQQSAAKVIPGTQLEWTVTARDQPSQGLHGRAMVGKNGLLEMGPYGSAKVAGLTIAKAETAVQSQLRRFLRDPYVTLRIVPEQTPLADAPAASGPITRWSSEESEGKPQVISGISAEQGPVRLVSGQPNLAQAAEELQPPRVIAEPTLGMGPPLAFQGPDQRAPHECQRILLPPYVIGPPDILQIESLAGLKTQQVTGPHLVRPDGTVGLGIYGSIPVAGLTLNQTREGIARAIHARLSKDFKLEDVYKNVAVDVIAYNSKVYYVITDGGGYGEQVTRLPITGNETVLDAISLNALRTGIYGLPAVASKRHIWVARPDCHGKEQVLPVDWVGISQRGQSATNYQLLPGDRVYVKADKWRTLNATVDKVVAPFERILGATLLGSTTVNSIRGITTIP